MRGDILFVLLFLMVLHCYNTGFCLFSCPDILARVLPSLSLLYFYAVFMWHIGSCREAFYREEERGGFY